ncbi:hypothetical protein [Haloferax marisrubri]|nr:hypothetical protein [Haloferax marisrubri]
MRYKQNYRKQMEEKLKDAGSIRRVHTEPTTRTTDEEGHNFVDVVVFRDHIDGVIEWTSSGSKRYPRDAIEVAIELKFVKNLRKPETPESGETARDTYLLKDIQSLRNRTAEGTTRYFFVVSLLDHLYVDDNHDPVEWKNEQYAEWGQQAQRWLADSAGDVQILYVTPMQKTWLTD